MSHFTVLVFGENVDEQMAPFAEEPQDEKYLKLKEYLASSLFYCENLEEVEEKFRGKLARCLEGNWDRVYFEGKQVFEIDEDTVEKLIVTAKELYVKVKELYERGSDVPYEEENEGMLGYKFGYMTNPDSFWDWYSIGGRWLGFFNKKKGTEGVVGEHSWTNFGNELEEDRVDVLRICDIDLDAMREENARRAGVEYDQFERIMKKVEDPKSSEEDKKSWIENTIRMYGMEKEGRVKTKEECMEEARKEPPFSTYGCVYKGKYYSKGEMGWWAVSFNDKEQADWNDELWKLIQEQDPETTITLLDCHV